MAGLDVHTCEDLLWHLPTRHEDRRQLQAVADLLAAAGDAPVAGTLLGEVVGHQFVPVGGSNGGRGARGGPRGRRATLQLRISDGAGEALLWCYGRAYLRSGAPVGSRVLVHGTFTRRGSTAEASDFELQTLRVGAAPEEVPWFGRIVPVYPLTAGITQLLMRRLTLQLLASQRADAADAEFATEQFLPVREALLSMHWPQDFARLAHARSSVAFSELVELQRALVKRQPPRRDVRTIGLSKRAAVVKSLPFALTVGQREALRDIDSDLTASAAGARLLQGDVGCGKTLVALLAGCAVVEGGRQVALVVPTELLARQHAATAERLLAPVGINVACLVGGSGSRGAVAGEGGGAIRRRGHLLAALRGGDVDLVIGTHALLRDDVTFQDLGLVVVDEQHRFGVTQRRALRAKGTAADLLLMTATPIPRSLALTVYGDLRVSAIRDLPAGRRRVRTHLARMDRLDEVLARVGSELDGGGQAYLVAPRIGDPDLATGGASSDHLDIHTLAARVAEGPLRRVRVGVVHGGLDDEQKNQVMEDFRIGEVRALLATTVVEVGVDVPAATCMVVLNAERFGLATLHQLRGRVGRGEAQSYAFLVYDPSLTPRGVQRLRAMLRAHDGFAIAELDLGQRGPGELLGLRQAGLPQLRVADLAGDIELAQLARERVHADYRG